MKAYKVYRHTCPNGKIYIGITSQVDVRRRWQYGYGYHNNVLFYFGSHSEETKKKISEAQKGEKNHMFGKHSWAYGKKQTPEHREKNRIGHLGQPSYWKGKHLPESAKEKLRKPKTEEHKRKLSEAKSIPVICVETGEYFKSGKEAGEAMGISRGSIAYAVKGKRHTAGGYHWRYA